MSNEFDKFTSVDGESIESVYERFSRLMNDMDHHEIYQIRLLSTQSFLTHFSQNGQNKVNVNASKEKRAAKAHDPLALVANTYASPSHSRSSPTYYVMHPPSVSDFDDGTQSYAYQGTSSNTLNQAYVQDGRVDVQTKNVGNVGRAGRNTGRNVRSSGTIVYVQKTNGNIVTVTRVPRTTANSGQTPTVQCYNCNEKGYYPRACLKPRV
ncbi:hypothetical protein Tco_0389149 [Tanacetum coccineum]